MKFYQRIAQFNYQDGLCCWCLEPMEFVLPAFASGDIAEPLVATWEHIVPISRGGSETSRSNRVLAHFRCNVQRGNDMSVGPRFTAYPA